MPALFAAGAVLLALALLSIGERFARSGEPLDFLYAGTPEGARNVLGMLAGSMIGTAGVTFSITIVALSLASSQFGSRLLRNFLRDPGNQIVLGSFVATFLYCLVVLRSVVDEAPVPALAITGAVALSIASLGVLIYFFHHVATSIQASSVVSAVAHDLERAIDRFCNGTRDCADEETAALPAGGTIVTAERSGYIQAIDHEGLVSIAVRREGLVEALHRAGDFVIAGGALARIATSASQSEADEDVAPLRRAFMVGPQRTPDQDLEYSVRQLVEIAVRALSPGINDPFTAINCIDWLGVATAQLARRGMPARCYRDDDGQVRLIANAPTFPGVVDAAFQQIRQAGAGHVAVAIRLLETFTAVAGHVQTPPDAETLRLQIDRVFEAALAAGPIEADAAMLAARHAHARQALDPARLSAAGEGRVERDRR